MGETKKPKKLSNIRYGQLVTSIDEETGDSENWLVIQTNEKGHCHAGLFRLTGWKDLRFGWFWGSIRYDVLSEMASEMLGEDRINLMLANYDEKEYIWLQAPDENDGIWTPWGKIEYGFSNGTKTYPILWVKIWSDSAQSKISMKDIPSSKDIETTVTRILEDIASKEEGYIHTKISLSAGDYEYIARFHRPDDDEILFEMRETNTRNVRNLIRYPRKTGLWYETDAGLKLTWDPFVDVIYGDEENEENPIAVLRPYIERSTLPQGLDFPDTAKEMVSAKIVKDLLLLFKRGRRSWKLWLLGPEIGTRLVSLENESYSNSQVVLLADAKYLFDRQKNSLFKIRVALDFDAKKMIIPKIFLTSPVLHSALVGKGVLPEGGEPDFVDEKYPNEETEGE
ncbi:MAG: hypothetical protein BAJATHORv1_80050 [Candidatus Thorarchaeota archaeon]|nr:MAG: hypothetical protein BAJATHORv1_80050 [Candidatus Thorarchaeota archaeon]